MRTSPARGFHREQVFLRAGYPQHVAVRGEDHLWQGGQCNGLVHLFERGHAHRAARTMNQVDLRRQHLVETRFDDGMRLSPAHLHQCPVAGDCFCEIGEQFLTELCVAVFIDVFHSNTVGARYIVPLSFFPQRLDLPEQFHCFHGFLFIQDG